MPTDTATFLLRFREQSSRGSPVSAGSSGLIATFLLRFLSIIPSISMLSYLWVCNGHQGRGMPRRF